MVFRKPVSQARGQVLPASDTSTRGNFVAGDCIWDTRCRHGHETRMFNINRGHYIACDECKTYLFLGSNLASSWHRENDDIWQANRDSIKGYD